MPNMAIVLNYNMILSHFLFLDKNRFQNTAN